MDGNSTDQRRRHRRIDTALPVRISTIEADRDPWTGRPYFRTSQETCANLSRGGAFVRTGELLDPGKRVLLEIALPDGSQVEAIGRVAWTRRLLEQRASEIEAGVGIEFLGGASSQLSALADFVARRDDVRGDS
jgi:hypothetical protein